MSRHPQTSINFRFCDSSIAVRLVERHTVDTVVPVEETAAPAGSVAPSSTDGRAMVEQGAGGVSPARRLVFNLAAVFAEQAGYAAKISHRPDDVRRVFIDANARCWMATSALESPDMQAIRAALREIAADPAGGGREALAQRGLTDAVIAWVLS